MKIDHEAVRQIAQRVAAFHGHPNPNRWALVIADKFRPQTVQNENIPAENTLQPEIPAV